MSSLVNQREKTAGAYIVNLVGVRDRDRHTNNYGLEQDGAEPSPNSVAASNLLRLHNLLGNDEYAAKAKAVFSGAGSTLAKHPHALPQMVVALGHKDNPMTQVRRRLYIAAGVRLMRCAIHSLQAIVVQVKEDDKSLCEEMANVIRQQTIYNRALIYVNVEKPGLVLTKNAHVKEVIEGVKETSVLICRGTECLMPATTVDEVKERFNDV